MNKRILLLFCIFVLLFSSATVFADVEVSGGTYVTVGTSQLGKITIYIPKEAEENWCFINGLPYYTGTSTLTGYVLNNSGGGKYTIRIYNYINGWDYRTYGSSTSTYQALTVNAYFPKESNIFVKKYRSNTQNLLLYSVIVIAGISIINIFFKRS